MTQLVNKAWHALGSIRLTVAVCWLLAADLGCGYFFLRERLEIFVPISDVGLFDWVQTYGAANRLHTAWFFAMLALLAVLAANTFACTTARVSAIVAQRHRWRELPFRLAPHLMHYAVLIILAGYLASYLLSTSDTGHALRPGEAFVLTGTKTTLRFDGYAPEILNGKRVEAFDGFVMRPNAQITLSGDGTKTRAVLNFNEPLRIDGRGVYLSDFQPRQPGKGMGRPYISLIVRHDPSAIVYRFGMGVFVVGLALYVGRRKLKRQEGIR